MKLSFTMSEAAGLAFMYFGLILPTTEVQLKKAYRKKAMETHPDRDGGSTELFKSVKAAYEKLSSEHAMALGVILIEGATISIFKTTTGEVLAELGLGLGPTQNGIDCPECKHLGYRTFHDARWGTCMECQGSKYVPLKFPCRSCNQKGKILTVDNKIVSCLPCGGTGRVAHHSKKVFCPACIGTGVGYTRAGMAYHQVCWRCEGTGEIPISNPVLPKGRLMLRG